MGKKKAPRPAQNANPSANGVTASSPSVKTFIPIYYAVSGVYCRFLVHGLFLVAFDYSSVYVVEGHFHAAVTITCAFCYSVEGNNGPA